jgi:hypothetical protein
VLPVAGLPAAAPSRSFRAPPRRRASGRAAQPQARRPVACRCCRRRREPRAPFLLALARRRGCPGRRHRGSPPADSLSSAGQPPLHAVSPSSLDPGLVAGELHRWIPAVGCLSPLRRRSSSPPRRLSLSLVLPGFLSLSLGTNARKRGGGPAPYPYPLAGLPLGSGPFSPG